MEMAPVAGLRIAASTNADWSALPSWHAPPRPVPLSWYAVAKPLADNGLAGTARVQAGFASAGSGAATSACVAAACAGAAVGDVVVVGLNASTPTIAINGKAMSTVPSRGRLLIARNLCRGCRFRT